MKVTYIRHSGFMVELEKSILLFDWWKGDLPVIDPEKDLYVFVSHGHEDHYSEQIWSLEATYPAQYILYEDVAPEKNADNILRVIPHQKYDLGGFGASGRQTAAGNPQSAEAAADEPGIHIETLLSTDQGVAFLVETEGKTIYHAGDLNIWYWDDEPEEDNRWQIQTYKEEMARLAGKQIDAAFVPMDPRLGEHAVLAAVCFLERNQCSVLFPMHYWERVKKIQEYIRDPRLAPYADLVCTQREVVL